MIKKINYKILAIVFISILCLYWVLIRQILNAPQKIKSDPINITLIEDELLAQNALKSKYKILKNKLIQQPYNRPLLLEIQQFWQAEAKLLLPYYYYLGEEGMIFNSETKLFQASKFFYENIGHIKVEDFKKWFGAQAKRYLEKIQTLNPNNDSASVLLGATLLFSGYGNPMDAVAKIKSVLDRDSTFLFAQFMLGYAAFFSGQYEKAKDRFLKVKQENPSNTENLLLLAGCFENLQRHKEAVSAYTQLYKLVKDTSLKKSIRERIELLK